MFTSANTAEDPSSATRTPRSPSAVVRPAFRGLQRTVLAQLLNGQLEIPSDATSACLQSIMPSGPFGL